MTAHRYPKPDTTCQSEAAGKPSEPPGHSSGVHRAARPRSSSWTVAEKFVRDGYRYRLMRQPIESSELGPRLTAREEQALVLACNCENNKQIAEALGVAPSTVGVLLFRAARKFGVRTRQELLAAYRHAFSEPPDPIR